MARSSKPPDDRAPHEPAGAEAAAVCAPWVIRSRSTTCIDMQWLVAVSVLCLYGSIFFGWRCLLQVGLTLLATCVGWRLTAVATLRPGQVQLKDRGVYVVVLAILMGISLPVTHRLATPLVSGCLLGVAAHGFGRTHRLRVHPVAVVLMLIGILPETLSLYAERASHRPAPLVQPVAGVLRPARVFIGDLLDIDPESARSPGTWWSADNSSQHDAIERRDPFEVFLHLQSKTLAKEQAAAAADLSVVGLCTANELFFGATPGPIGVTNRLLVIAIGLWLAHRRLCWWPMLLTGSVAYAGVFLVLPVEMEDAWQTVATRLMTLGPLVTTTYVTYLILSSPLVPILFLLSPLTAPTCPRGRLAYGAIIGTTAAAAQWFLATPTSPYLGLVVAGLFSRQLDRWHKSGLARHGMNNSN